MICICGKEYPQGTYYVQCLCGNIIDNSPEICPIEKVMEPEFCEHLNCDGNCEIVYLINSTLVQPTNEICVGCQRDPHPRNVNPVTIALSGIETKDSGPGSTLHSIITWFIEQPEGCPCPNRVLLMNSWGAKKCLEEKVQILGWLRESAATKGIKYSEFVLSATLTAILYGCLTYETLTKKTNF